MKRPWGACAVTLPGLQQRLLDTPVIVPRSISTYTSPEFVAIDESQIAAAKAASTQDVTVIWGPPGTGKTRTLARLIASLAQQGRRVLAVAIANVAVDQIALAVVEALDELDGSTLLEDGAILRLGHAADSRALDEPRLFPIQRRSQELRRRLARVVHDRGLASDLIEKARLTDEISELHAELDSLVRICVQKARVLLTTVLQTCIMANLPEEEVFDTVVVDEASMVSVPYLLASASRARSAVTIAGDFRQLGPIALSRTGAARRWLHPDAFEHLGVVEHPELHKKLVRMLIHQRRMHPHISACINATFYDGALRDQVDINRLRSVQRGPLSGRGAVVVDVSEVPELLVEVSKGGSRKNIAGAIVAAQLAAWFANTGEKASVGVITPYNRQVRLIRARLAELGLPENDARVQVGTVHTFQGSERDIIIWDTVETNTANPPLGKPFRDDTGRRLVNVAISRARAKLILLAVPAAFGPERGGATCNVLHHLITRADRLRNHTVTWAEVEPLLRKTGASQTAEVQPPARVAPLPMRQGHLRKILRAVVGDTVLRLWVRREPGAPSSSQVRSPELHLEGRQEVLHFHDVDLGRRQQVRLDEVHAIEVHAPSHASSPTY